MRCLPVEHDLMHRPTLGRAAAHHAVYAMLGHELEGAHRTALDRLPALDRQLERSRDEGELFEGVAAIRHLGRQRVVLALIREALVVEGFEDDIAVLSPPLLLPPRPPPLPPLPLSASPLLSCPAVAAAPSLHRSQAPKATPSPTPSPGQCSRCRRSSSHRVRASARPWRSRRCG